jgi:hypothetical protein
MNYKMMMDMPYLGAYSLADLPKKEITLTIKSVKAEKIIGEGGKSNRKPVARFKEEGQAISPDNVVKPMVLNSTNCKTLADLAKSNDTDNWNLRITVFATQTTFGGKQTDCLRIRPFLAEEPKTAAPVKCEGCGNNVISTGGYTADQIVKMAREKYNKTFCMACAKAEKAKLDAQQAQQAQDDTKEEGQNEEAPQVDS